VNSIRDEAVALDTNEFIFALRRDPDHPACEILLFDKLNQLHVYIPLQVLIELQRKLGSDEMRGVLLALTKAIVVDWDYAPASLELIARWEERGAKKGDAVIAAHLEAAGVRYLISENRDFLVELTDLPFEALTAEKALQLLS
jgi:predicted nucleic acid-binding protein